jgi:hypothetical protein
VPTDADALHDGRLMALRMIVEVCVRRGYLGPEAARWKTVVALETAGEVLGYPRSGLKNVFYRDPRRFIDIASGLYTQEPAELRSTIEKKYAISSNVWHRTNLEAQRAFSALLNSMDLLEEAVRVLRQSGDVADGFRRSVGRLAVETMANAQMFMGGQERRMLLQRAEVCFLDSMAPISFSAGLTSGDAALFGRFLTGPIQTAT